MMISNNTILKRRWNKRVSLFLVLNFFTTVLLAQNVVVKGTVKNEQGEPLVGAYVKQWGTNNATPVTKNGTFELKNVAPDAVLQASLIGYTSVSLKLKQGQTNVDFILKSSIIGLKDVTVNTGLYKRSVGSFTGSAKTYTGEELKMVNPRSVIQALAVVDPSVRVAANNQFGSDPNQLPNLQIRGANNLPVSLQGNTNASTPVSNGDIMASYLANPNQPLIIIDGFQSTLQVLYDMDINLIATITVLKDAAATVAYGSKAANGVIVVETKQPAQGKLRVTYSVNANIELPDLSSYNLMNAEQILEAQRLAGIYSDANYYNDVAKNQWYDYRLAQIKNGVNTYWLSQPLQAGWGVNHSLSLSGGGSQLRYAFSLNYNNGEGVMKGSGRDRYGMTYNVGYVGKKIKVNNSISLGYMKANNTAWGSFSSYASQFPYLRNNDDLGNPIKILEPIYTDLGFLVPAPGGIFTNPSYNSTLNVKDYNTNLNINNKTNIEWSITDDLKLSGNFGWSANTPGGETFFPAEHTSFAGSNGLLTDLGSYQQIKGNNSAIDGRIGLNYRLKLGRNTLLAALGSSLQKTYSNGTTIIVTGIPNDNLAEIGLANGFSVLNNKPRTNNNLTKGLSNFISLSYNFDDRYTAEFTANQSGSSQFGSNSKLAPFYAGGVAWNISKEKFFKPNNIIESAKLRASIGTTGNQNFASDMSQQIYSYSLTNNYRLMLGAVTSSYANADLKWQQTLKSNIGLTLGLFKGRVNTSFEFYRETTDNLILPLDIAPSTGFVSYNDNLGATKNQGYEFGISTNLIKNSKSNIFWTIGFNAGHYSNTITKLSPAVEAINKKFDVAVDPNKPLDSRFQTSPRPKFEVGESMSRIWAVPSLGIDPATGKEIFMKLDGSRTFEWDPTDKRPIADANAKIKGAFSSNFNYKNFVLNFNLVYQYGGYMYNQTLVDRVENINLLRGNADVRVLTERWLKPGDHTSFKGLVANGEIGLQQTNATSRFVQKDNFIDLSSITVGYNFPANLKWVKAAHLSAPKLMVTQNNLIRWGTIKTERGTSYPFSRSLSFGLSTNF